MRYPYLAIGVRVGLLAAAATAGVLCGFGLPLGAPAAVFSAAGDRLRGLPPLVAPDRGFGASACVGAAQHVTLVVPWSLLFVRVAAGRRPPTAIAAALVTAFAATMLSRLLPVPLRLAAGLPSVPQQVVVAIALAGALGVGIRLAQRWVPSADRVRIAVGASDSSWGDET